MQLKSTSPSNVSPATFREARRATALPPDENPQELLERLKALLHTSPLGLNENNCNDPPVSAQVMRLM